MTHELGTQVGQLARRSVVRTLRQPAQIVPSLIFPLFLLAVNSGGLKSVTNLPGFPTDSYLTFALAITFMQGALFSVINSGTDLARDIETGFLNRMALTPLRGAALLSGLLAGSLLLGLMQALAYLTVGLAFGAELTAGIGGFFVIIALSVTVTVAFGTIGMFAALRTGSGEAVQGLFPVFFVFLFLSSMALPLNLIQTDWFHTVKAVAPISTESAPPMMPCQRRGIHCTSTRSVTRNQKVADAALDNAASTLMRIATVGAMGRIENTRPIRTKNGLPGGCGRPSTYAAAMYSLVSHMDVVGASVMRYRTNATRPAIQAARYDGR